MPDFDRPLNERGRATAPRMGAYMRAQKLMPDRVIVSSAVRTRETWALVAPELPIIEDVLFDRRIYEAPPQAILAVIREQLEAGTTLLVVGHNPGLQMLALSLARRDPTPSRRRLGDKYPTAGLVVLDILIEDWADLMPDTAVLERFVTPAMVGASDADD